MSRCSPSSIIAIFHTTGLLSLLQNKIRAGKLLIDPGHLQEEHLGGRPHYRYRRARRHSPVVDRALQKKTQIADDHGQKWPKTMVSLKWRVFKLCCPAHLFPNTPPTYWNNSMKCYICKEKKSTYLLICESFKSAYHGKAWVRKLSQLRNSRKSYILFNSAKLRICDLRNLFADRPPLPFPYNLWRHKELGRQENKRSNDIILRKQG